MPFTHLYRSYPQLSLCTLLLLLLGLLGVGLHLHLSKAQQDAQINGYGQALASTAARQAVEATLNQDMLSLQAILQDITRNTAVVGATVHNLENQLLVQSGYDPHQNLSGKRYDFTAPIALHNNIAGYLRVTLSQPDHSHEDQLFLAIWVGAVMLALLIIWWSIQLQWWRNLRDKLPSPTRLMFTMIEKLPDIPEAPPEPEPKEPDLPSAPQVAVRLHIHIHNLNRLYEQLNSESFSGLLRRFEKQLQDVLILYRGQRLLLNQGVLVIDFIGESYADCSFRALCCAQLLSNLCTAAPSPRLQVCAHIHSIAVGAHYTGQSLLKDFIAQQQDQLDPQRGEILISRKLLDEELFSHAEIVPDTGKLLAIKPPYCELLAKQEASLQPPRAQ